MPSEKLKLAIDEATQAYQLADDAVHKLFKVVRKESPFVATTFLEILKESAQLRQRLENFQAAAN